jgi:hypothetical protein
MELRKSIIGTSFLFKERFKKIFFTITAFFIITKLPVKNRPQTPARHGFHRKRGLIEHAACKSVFSKAGQWGSELIRVVV